MNGIIAKELQEKIMYEAIAMIALGGEKAEVANHVRTVELIGTAWGFTPSRPVQCWKASVKARQMAYPPM